MTQPVEPLFGPFLVDESLGFPDPRQAFLEVGIDNAYALSRQLVQAYGLAPENHRGNRKRHHNGQDGQPEDGIDDHEGDAYTEERDHRNQGREEPVFDKRFELVHVGRHPRHDAARHFSLVIVKREPLQLGPDADTQRKHDPLCGPPGYERFPHFDGQVGQRDEQVDNRCHQQDA